MIGVNRTRNSTDMHAVAKLPLGRVVDSVTGKGMSFGQIKQYQNPSGHGIDILAQISTVDPPPPPNAGDFVAFEVKSTLGAVDDPPRLSGAQKDAKGFTRIRLELAKAGQKGFPELSMDDADIIDDAIDAIASNKMQFRKIDIRMDHSGALASTTGKTTMEIKSW